MSLPLVAARFVHFAATLGLFGASLFAAIFAEGELRRTLSRFALPLALISLVSAGLWLVFLAREMADGEIGFGVLGEVLTDTAFGAVWRFRLVLLLALALWPRAGYARLALAALATASLGLVGHAAREDGVLGLLHRGNHALHLLAAGAWIGGLAPFLICLRVFFANPEGRDALAAMRRFSFFGHFAVATTLLTGVVETGLTLRALPWPPDTPYRVDLCVKIAVVVAMAALALVNRYVFAPRIGRSSSAARALAAGAVGEIALAGMALALVSRFATFDPS